MADLTRLLELQDRDLALDQLRHRRETLPARTARADRHAQLGRVDAELERVRERLDELSRAQKRLEDEIASVEAKADAERRKLNSGTVTAPREIHALSDEVDALGRRQRSLEDDVLELMEQAEPAAADAERLRSERDALGRAVDELVAELAAEEAAIDTETAALCTARDELASGIDPALVERYERMRAKLGGIAVARLEGDRCLGCHISLPAVEVDRIRHASPDAIVTHEECGRILVR